MAILQFANNASSTLAQNITGVDTTIYLAAGEGSLFPIPTADKNFYATIYNTSSTLWEIVLVTARVGDTLTVIRAQEGTIAQTWLVGDSLGMYPTAATMNQLVQIDQLQQGTYTVVQAGGTANALTCQITSDLTSIPDGMTLVVKPVFQNTDATTLQVTIGSTVLSAVPIVKGPNLAIEATDIPSAGYPVQLIYSVIYGAWVMQMPSTLISPPIPPTYTINYLAVAGGGGGYLGGGGAGGTVSGTITTLSGSYYGVTIGAGGAIQSSGYNSSIAGIVTVTGGGNGNFGTPGGNGGSGGGAGAFGTDVAAGPYSGGNGIPGQGNNGGSSGFQGAQAGGGGGAAAPGGNGISQGNSGGGVAGAGGAGVVSTLTGSTLYYGGGGGGAVYYPGGSGGAGGIGGGGTGNTASGTPGIVNTGGGGGGGSTSTTGDLGPFGSQGGSGVVIMSMLTSRYTGSVTGSPTVNVVGSNTVLVFTNSGSYTA